MKDGVTKKEHRKAEDILTDNNITVTSLYELLNMPSPQILKFHSPQPSKVQWSFPLFPPN